MKNFAIKKPLSKNQLDDLTNGLVNAMRYSDPNVEYPSYDKAKQDDGVMAEWFYPIFNGTNDFSELTAIHMYTTQEATFEDVGELLLGIALTETETIKIALQLLAKLLADEVVHLKLLKEQLKND